VAFSTIQYAWFHLLWILLVSLFQTKVFLNVRSCTVTSDRSLINLPPKNHPSSLCLNYNHPPYVPCVVGCMLLILNENIKLLYLCEGSGDVHMSYTYTPHTIRNRTWRVLLYMHHPQTYDYIVCFPSSHWLNSALCNNTTGSNMKTWPTSSTHLQVGWMLLYMLSKIWTQIKRTESTTSDYSSYIKDDPKCISTKQGNPPRNRE